MYGFIILRDGISADKNTVKIQSVIVIMKYKFIITVSGSVVNFSGRVMLYKTFTLLIVTNINPYHKSERNKKYFFITF